MLLIKIDKVLRIVLLQLLASHHLQASVSKDNFELKIVAFFLVKSHLRDMFKRSSFLFVDQSLTVFFNDDAIIVGILISEDMRFILMFPFFFILNDEFDLINKLLKIDP